MENCASGKDAEVLEMMIQLHIKIIPGRQRCLPGTAIAAVPVVEVYPQVSLDGLRGASISHLPGVSSGQAVCFLK